MNLNRRGVVGGASALALASTSSPALSQNKHAASAPVLVAAAADSTGFEAALRAKFATGDVLNWTGGTVRLRRPIHIDVTQSMVGAGVDLNGAKVIADFNDPTQRAITIRIPPAFKNVSVRGLKVFNGTFVADSPALDALGVLCLANHSWIYSWKIMNLDIEQFSRDGLFFAGNVFEGELHAVTCASNGRNGITFRHEGIKDDSGLVSAISIFGGQMRKNGNAGIETQSAIAYREPRDLNIRQTYFVENKGPGLNAVAGFSRAEGCGFVNNGGCGINMMNHGRLTDCQGSTHGPQPYLVKAFLNNGEMVIDGCRTEGFSGFEGKTRLGKISGKGTVTLRDSGQLSDLEISGDITAKMA
jgi:adhesin HecA-like repeat protein